MQMHCNSLASQNFISKDSVDELLSQEQSLLEKARLSRLVMEHFFKGGAKFSEKFVLGTDFRNKQS